MSFKFIICNKERTLVYSVWQNFVIIIIYSTTMQLAIANEIKLPVADPPTIDIPEHTFTIEAPAGGTVDIRIGEDKTVLFYDELSSLNFLAFGPPSFFSAPLPTGSGARALAWSSFSAVADDATAASWNPAGLISLEKPEIGFAFRHSCTRYKHKSNDESFNPNNDSYSSSGINYFSLVYPTFAKFIRRNFVVSLNYQETYDFSQKFNAEIENVSGEYIVRENNLFVTEQQTDLFSMEDGESRYSVYVNSIFNTKSSSILNQVINTKTDATLEFEQQGLIEAITPSFSINLNHTIIVGGSLNYYRDNSLPEKALRSSTKSIYTSRIVNTFSTLTEWVLDGSYTSGGEHWFVNPNGTTSQTNQLIPEIGNYDSQSGIIETETKEVTLIDGVVEEVSEFNDLEGFNSTLGVMWNPGNFITLGASIDLPWTAKANQTKTVYRKNTTFNETRTKILWSEESTMIDTKSVEFDFPLFWTIGAVYHWNQSLYSSIDVGKTHWSDFAFKVESEEAINPLDGSLHKNNPLDDTWTIRVGSEYLWILKNTEIPIRAGLVWEQRPAIGEPDDYYGYSVGSGISFGKGRGKTIVDIAYSYITADDVQTVIPSQAGLSTDTEQHQVYASIIVHF